MPPMDSIGADIALSKMGLGTDNTVLARRHGWWFDEPICYPSSECSDGATVAGYIMAAVRDRAVVHIDLFGVGAEPYGHLRGIGQQVVGCSVGEPARGVAKDGRLQFFNWRSELVWRMREALSPAAGATSRRRSGPSCRARCTRPPAPTPSWRWCGTTSRRRA